MVYLNEVPVSNVVRIKDGDKITVGNTELIFVPFCKEDRQWEEE